MDHDPFGNLTEWGHALHVLQRLAENGDLFKCQPGLIRILRYKGNWRLREEVLKCVGQIKAPSDDLICNVLSILEDDNIYYDARIIAGKALMQLMNNMDGAERSGVYSKAHKTVENLRSIPHPPIFEKVLNRLSEKAFAPQP